MVLQAFVDALNYLVDPQIWLFICVGIIIGIIIGIMPGIGTILALSLMLPFLFTLTPEKALPMLVACIWANPVGGVITSVLIGVPGNVSNVATIVDGYPMTKKGEGARALGAALASSGLAGIVGVFFSLAIVPLVLPLVYAINSGDMVFLILMGLGFVAVLSKGSPLKGLIGGAIGIVLSLVGLHMITGQYRFTFGSQYLTGGFPIVSVALGLFALPELVEFALEKTQTMVKIDKEALGIEAVLQGVKDVFRHWWLWLRCLVIGWFVGILPGVGGLTSIWIAYGHAKQSSKHPERFGTGVVEGVLAPEAANNSENTGALLTTLALGIPGSAVMVLLLAALIMLNIMPGPEMMTTHLALTMSTMQVGMISSFLAAVICILLVPYLIRLVNVPSRILVPMIAIAIYIGAYAEEGVFLNLVVLLVFGALGVLMNKFGFSRPAMVLGFVMGSLFEKYLFIAVGTAGPLFFLKPTTLGIIAVTAALFAYEPVKSILARRSKGRSAKA